MGTSLISPDQSPRLEPEGGGKVRSGEAWISVLTKWVQGLRSLRSLPFIWMRQERGRKVPGGRVCCSDVANGEKRVCSGALSTYPSI